MVDASLTTSQDSKTTLTDIPELTVTLGGRMASTVKLEHAPMHEVECVTSGSPVSPTTHAVNATRSRPPV
jgi:hypothetical protein